MKKFTLNKQHLIMATAALVGATLGGLGATLLPDASGQWVQPALMLGIVGGLLGYIIHDLVTRRPRTTLRALAVTTLAVPLLTWLLSGSGLFAILAAIVTSLAVYIKGRMDDRWTQQVALGGASQAIAEHILDDQSESITPYPFGEDPFWHGIGADKYW